MGEYLLGLRTFDPSVYAQGKAGLDYVVGDCGGCPVFLPR